MGNRVYSFSSFSASCTRTDTPLLAHSQKKDSRGRSLSTYADALQPILTDDLKVDDRIRFLYNDKKLEGIITGVEDLRVCVEVEVGVNSMTDALWVDKSDILVTIPKVSGAVKESLKNAWWLDAQEIQVFATDGLHNVHIPRHHRSLGTTLEKRGSIAMLSPRTSRAQSFGVQNDSRPSRRLRKKHLALSEYERRLWSKKLQLAYKLTLKKKFAKRNFNLGDEV